jgi:hypothetical protein
MEHKMKLRRGSKWRLLLAMPLAVFAVSARHPWIASANAQTQAPAASITSIDNKTGLVSAKVNATGQQFEFKLSNPAQLRTISAGQPIYANFTTRQVSLDGKTPSGTIVSITPIKASPLDGVRTPAAPIDGAVEKSTQRSRFTVSQIQGGYVFQNVSAKLMSVLPNGTKVELTLDHTARGKSTVIGIVTKTSAGFQIKTPDRLSFDAPGAWLLVRSIRTGSTAGGSTCGGCPRDPHMDLDQNETSCWCIDNSTPTVMLGQPGTATSGATGCSGAPAR